MFDIAFSGIRYHRVTSQCSMCTERKELRHFRRRFKSASKLSKELPRASWQWFYILNRWQVPNSSSDKPFFAFGGDTSAHREVRVQSFLLQVDPSDLSFKQLNKITGSSFKARSEGENRTAHELETHKARRGSPRLKILLLPCPWRCPRQQSSEQRYFPPIREEICGLESA